MFSLCISLIIYHRFYIFTSKKYCFDFLFNNISIKIEYLFECYDLTQTLCVAKQMKVNTYYEDSGKVQFLKDLTSHKLFFKLRINKVFEF